LPNLDYYFDREQIFYLEEKSVDNFYLRNVIHLVKDLSKLFNILNSYLKEDGILEIVDCREECYKTNYLLDNIYYRFVNNKEKIFINEKYRNYFKLLELTYNNEKEKSIWIKSNRN
jgi:hypothetical protein